MRQLVLELAPPPVPTLDSYFPGRSAQAVAALRDLLAGGERFVYLWGEAGSGKTHLLRAVVSEALALGRSALYAGAPHAGLVPPPAQEILAIDDVDSLDIDAQLALFDSFNAARMEQRCVITAGRRPAAELPVRDDLRTRLGSGVSLRLNPLDDVEKAAALADHAARRGLRLGADLIAYVLTHCRRDMGTQVAVLEALDRHSLEQKRPVTLALLRDALRGLEF